MQWMGLGNLWFALIIPAIIVLYLLKRKVEDRVVPSTLLWQRTLQNWEAVRPWEKLRRNLLLILQLLAACLLVLALTRPALPTEGIAADHTVLVMDTSASMLAKEGEATRLARAVSEAKALVEKLGSGQTMTLIAAGSEPNVLVSRSADHKELLAALEKLTAHLGASDPLSALSLAGAIAANEPGSGVIWIGDGHAEHKLALQALPASSANFRFMQMGRSRENAGIAAFVTQPGQEGVEALLRVDNYGSAPSRGTVTVFDDQGKLLDTDSFAIEASGSQTFSFRKLPKSPAYRAVIEPEQDSLLEDNTIWSVPFSTSKGKAVLYSPAGNRFLHQVMQTVGSMEVETIQKAPKPDAEARDLWVFDGEVPDKLPPGNILVIAPDRKTDWLPLSGEKELEQGPQAVSADDPLLKYVDWREVHIAKAQVLGEMPGMRTVVRAGDVELVRTGVIDGRRVAIIAFDLHDSDFPLRPAFPIFMRNVVNWLSPAQATPIAASHPGDVLSIPLTPGASERRVTYPDGQQQPITAEGTVWTMQVPEQLGLYRIDETLDTGQVSRYFSVRISDAESDITPKALSVSGVSTGQSEGDKQAASATGTQELTYWLAALVLLVLLVEWRVYQRGY